MKDKRLIVGELVFEDCLRKWSLGIDPVVIKSHRCQISMQISFVITPLCGWCVCCSFDMIESDLSDGLFLPRSLKSPHYDVFKPPRCLHHQCRPMSSSAQGEVSSWGKWRRQALPRSTAPDLCSTYTCLLEPRFSPTLICEITPHTPTTHPTVF